MGRKNRKERITKNRKGEWDLKGKKREFGNRKNRKGEEWE